MSFATAASRLSKAAATSAVRMAINKPSFVASMVRYYPQIATAELYTRG